MAQHTPGPWTVQTIEPDWEISGDMLARIKAPLKLNGEGKPGMPYIVATLNFVAMKRSPYTILRNEGEANARLIAAAPDLLAACQRLAEWDRSRPPDSAQLISEACSLARVAITKATQP